MFGEMFGKDMEDSLGLAFYTVACRVVGKGESIGRGFWVNGVGEGLLVLFTLGDLDRGLVEGDKVVVGIGEGKVVAGNEERALAKGSLGRVKDVSKVNEKEDR